MRKVLAFAGSKLIRAVAFALIPLTLLFVSLPAGTEESGSEKLERKGPEMSEMQGMPKVEDEPNEYDDETGEPLCGSCHTSDRKPAIDYTSDPECLQCHNADYSKRFLAIDERYKVSVEEVTESYRHHAKIDRQKSSRESARKSAGEKSENMANKESGQVNKEKINIPQEMIHVPAGEFIMGSDEWWPKSGPQHKRSLPAYLIDKYEVTNREYNDFVAATQRKKPDNWKGGLIPAGRESHPVTFVTWFDAKEYCEWKGKRLPTEAEWEKAARGTDGRAFPWGDKFDKNKANTPQYGRKDTMPAGSFEDGKSPYGAYDMAGNVFEWTSDWYKAYPGNKHPDPNEGERYRVVRGGSWYDCTFYKCGISAPTFNRIFFNPFTRNNNFGFRCVKDVE